MIRREFPVKGTTNRIMVFGMDDEGGNEVAIQKAMRRNAERMVMAHSRLREEIEKVKKEEEEEPEVLVDEERDTRGKKENAYAGLENLLIEVRI